MKKTGVLILVTGLLAASVYIMRNKKAGNRNLEPQTSSMMKVGPSGLGQAPDFSLTDLDEKNVKLLDLRGKVVVLNFWATWCPPCREEIPDLIQLHNKYAQQGLIVLGVSLDEEGVEGVKSFAKKNNISYPIVMGNQTLAGAYGGIRAIPATFIINREGKIIEKIVGGRGLKEFEESVKPAL